MSELEMVLLLAIGLVLVLVVLIMKTVTLRAQRRVLASMNATLAAIEENQRLVAAMRKTAAPTKEPTT